MKKIYLLLFSIAFACETNKMQLQNNLSTDVPLSLHPENSHYFYYKGKPLVLITSAEHYGALLNPDFDYKKYLKTLASEGMNYTRIFTGSYFEISGQSFGINNNTLAPNHNRAITPWTANHTADEKLIYDLSEWNPDYFKRFHHFLQLADSLNIIVEVTLFSSIYTDDHWDINPQNPANNTNLDGELDRKEAHTLSNNGLLVYQLAYVRKIVRELNVYNNIFFEVQNEPWADRPVVVMNQTNREVLDINDWKQMSHFADEAALQWQDTIVATIAQEESGLDKKHLIAQNYTNYRAPIPYVHQEVDIINFHYAWPEAVQWNYHYDKVIGFDESGFAGKEDMVYRRQAWQFILSGGALFNNLDYSFYSGKEDGTGVNQAPGGGSKELRYQLRILNDFIHEFNLPAMSPDYTSVLNSAGMIPYVLSNPDKAYAVYLKAIGTHAAKLTLKTGNGTFTVVSLNPVNGETSALGDFEVVDERLTVDLLIPEGEVALKISKKD